MKITNYQKIKSLNPDSLFLVDGATGTKTILAPDLARELLAQLDTIEKFNSFKFYELPGCSYPTLDANYAFPIQKEGGEEPIAKTGLYSMYWAMSDYTTNVQTKRSIYRGKNLGDHVTDEQWEEIKTGRFNGLFLGDYWVIDGINWVITDFDYWLGVGYGFRQARHHLVMQPASGAVFGRKKINNTATNSGGYLGSDFHKNLGPINDVVFSAFGREHILQVSRYYSTNVTNGVVTGGVWEESVIDMPAVENVFGVLPGNCLKDGDQKRQFALYRLFPDRIYQKDVLTWLVNMYENNAFFAVSGSGPYLTKAIANAEINIRPVFAIGVV